MKVKTFVAGSESAIDALVNQWLQLQGQRIHVHHVTSAANAINFMILILYSE